MGVGRWLRGVLCLLCCLPALRAGATHHYSYNYEFDHFKLRVFTLQGTINDSRVELYTAAAELNDYVRRLQQAGRLEPKPVVYCVFASPYVHRTVDVYEVRSEYRININPAGSHFLREHFTVEELRRIIDYFAGDDFEPFYCGREGLQFELSRELLFQKIDAAGVPTLDVKPDTCTIFSHGDWRVAIEFGQRKGMVFYRGEVLEEALGFSMARPVVMGDRLVVVHGGTRVAYDTGEDWRIRLEYLVLDRFSVFEGGKRILDRPLAGNWAESTQAYSNLVELGVYPQWINLYPYQGWSYDESYAPQAVYSYSYALNRIYKVPR